MVCGQGFHHLLEIDGRTHVVAPPQRLVDDNAGEPGRETRLATKSVERCQGADIGVLQRLFGLDVVAHDPSGNTPEHLVVLLHDRLRGASIALAEPLYEQVVVDDHVP